MSVNSKMTAIANEIRELSGTTGAMGLDVMANTLSAENANFASNLSAQDSLIAQIQTALQGKAGGSGSASPVLQSKVVNPTTDQQTVKPDSNYDGLSQVIVNAIPSTYVKPITTKTETTYTPTTSNQLIAAGTYCSGVQTIKGDANLVADNIKNGTSIFGVTGTYEGSSGSSGGAGVETCTLTIYGESPIPYPDGYVWYIDGSTSVKQHTMPEHLEEISITIMKNSIFFVTASVALVDNNISNCFYGSGWHVLFIHDDSSLATM